ncbi:hypothetical protein SVIOM74S_08369 [Streptomyces violarus]
MLKLREPQGDGVRTDSGLSEGTEVGSLYDPMLSKVIAYGPDRATALRKLRAALARRRSRWACRPTRGSCAGCWPIRTW